ncbi:hypothetical protein FRAHR75_150095 [Frankia sp. Hr75.2]|nr:hypothetical protein FRAHR75_150095 [Frankia sp. Hr75.2]
MVWRQAGLRVRTTRRHQPARKWGAGRARPGRPGRARPADLAERLDSIVRRLAPKCAIGLPTDHPPHHATERAG